MTIGKAASGKPNLGKHLFWEYRYDDIDWEKSYLNVIARVIERGNEEEWTELTRYYGRTRVIDTIETKIKYLPDYVIEKVCTYFNLQKEKLLCYIRKQSRPNFWI